MVQIKNTKRLKQDLVHSYVKIVENLMLKLLNIAKIAVTTKVNPHQKIL